jgi:hypothetical protein
MGSSERVYRYRQKFHAIGARFLGYYPDHVWKEVTCSYNRYDLSQVNAYHNRGIVIANGVEGGRWIKNGCIR